MPRPNAVPRPICRYYTTPRGCFAGPKCRYLHGDPSVHKHTPYEEHKTCRFYAQGYCKRGKDCWFKHVAPEVVAGTSAAHQADGPAVTEEDIPCGICFEDGPALYGLLSGCSHAFCLTCIRQWRDPEGKGIDMQESGTHKTCPMCRIATRYIVPSSRFYSQDDSRKADVIEKYKQSMARVPCRYFLRSKPGRRFCPFGRDCFYQHANSDGTPYEFAHGVDIMMRQWQQRRREAEPALSSPLFRDPLEAALEVLEGYADTLPSETDQTEEGHRHALTRRAMLDMHDYVLRLIRGESPSEPQPPPENPPEALLPALESPRPRTSDPDTGGITNASVNDPAPPLSAGAALPSNLFNGFFDSIEENFAPSTGFSEVIDSAEFSQWIDMISSSRAQGPDVLPAEGINSEEVTEVSRSPTPHPPSQRPLSPLPAISRPRSAPPHDLHLRSDDPRSPSNTTRSIELTTGDFAWMMEERREATREDNCIS